MSSNEDNSLALIAPQAPMGFEGSTADRAMVATEAGTTSLVAREEAELKSAIILARRFPRDEAASYTRFIKSCQRPSFAEGALYNFPRGGNRIEGPSVDMAREAARCWGNIRYGLRVVTVDREMAHIKGFAYDLETNNYVEAEDKFRILIQRRDKETGITTWVQPDERDFRELLNRRGAICVRNALLQILPPDVIDDAIAKVKETMRRAASGEIQQDRDAAIRRMAVAFSGIAVTPDMLSAYLNHPLEQVTDEELADLRGIYKSIIDGNSKRDDYFSTTPVGTTTATAGEAKSRTSGLIDKLKAAGTQQPPTDPAAQAPPPGDPAQQTASSSMPGHEATVIRLSETTGATQKLILDELKKFASVQGVRVEELTKEQLLSFETLVERGDVKLSKKR
jgi:hypothetical protein